MTIEQFIQNEILIWGEDYIFDLMDKNYLPVLLTDNSGESVWKWRYVTNEEYNRLTQPATFATVS